MKIENLTEAESLSQKLLRKNRNVITLGLLAKVHIYKYRESMRKGLNLIAEADKTKAFDLINEGLKMDSDNVTLRAMLESLK